MRISRHYPIGIGILLWLGSLTACYDSNSHFGESWVETAFRNVMVDSCTIIVTSTTIDSVETNNKGIALVGRYSHPLWGTATASSYVPYATPTYSTDADEVVRFDSMTLSLNYSGYAIGDTTRPMRLHVHQLQERIIPNDNGYIYNRATFPYDETPLASHTFIPDWKMGDHVEIRLPDALGEEMLERLHRRDDGVSGDHFQDYFKGLTIIPDETCESALAFQVNDTSAVVTLHYHIENEDRHESCDIKPDPESQFYHIDHNRTGTDLEELPEKNVEVASEELGGRGLVFGGVGWYSTLSFPHLNNILQLGDYVSIESAYLRIYPEPGTWTEYNPLPDSLYLYIVDENNVVTDAVTDYLGEEVQHATFVSNNSIVGENYYYFDVTTFMQEELGAVGMYKHSLRLVFDSDTYTGTFRNLTFRDQESENSIDLLLTFKIYESY